MSLLIHDLSQEEWERIKDRYEGWDVVRGDGSIRPCIGCFSCWAKTPGKCVIKDGFGDMGARIHKADRVTVISRYTYGGFSAAVKNVFDRSLGYVLPQFEISSGETHHRRRYEEDKQFDFIFYGHEISEEEKAAASRYVEAVCANVRSHVGEVIFREEPGESVPDRASKDGSIPPGTVILNGSMRGMAGNSGKLAEKVASLMSVRPETLEIRTYLNDMEGLVGRLEKTGTIVLCMPLYVDGIPSQMIRLMEEFERMYRGGKKRIYLISNMGLYESSQLNNLFGAVRQWCDRMGFEYCGGFGVSAGELIGVLMQYVPFGRWVTKDIAGGARKLAAAIGSAEKTEDIFAQPHLFPRLLFMWIANYSWRVNARKNGIRPQELYRRIEN